MSWKGSGGSLNRHGDWVNRTMDQLTPAGRHAKCRQFLSAGNISGLLQEEAVDTVCAKAQTIDCLAPG